VIAQDDPDNLKKMAEESGFGFPVLHDPEGETIQRYGLWNEAFTRGVVPHPAALVVDREGNVAWKRVDTDYRLRPPATDLVAAVAALGPVGE
jgi:peroxiredoxin